MFKLLPLLLSFVVVTGLVISLGERPDVLVAEQEVTTEVSAKEAYLMERYADWCRKHKTFDHDGLIVRLNEQFGLAKEAYPNSIIWINTRDGTVIAIKGDDRVTFYDDYDARLTVVCPPST